MGIGAAILHYAETAATKDPSGGQSDRPDHPIFNISVWRRDIWPGDDRNGGQLCPPLYYNLHRWDGTDNVSIRFWPETESAQRHVAGYALA